MLTLPAAALVGAVKVPSGLVVVAVAVIFTLARRAPVNAGNVNESGADRFTSRG